MAHVHKFKLSDGNEMPVIGFGTYSRNASPGQCMEAVEYAIDVGYRHFDIDTYRPGVEKEVGEAVQNKIKEGVVRREDLYILTKLWNSRHGKENVIPALKESLKTLKLDYVDLYLIHWPMSVSDTGEDLAIDHADTWKGMEEAVRLGLTKSIGVSNFNAEQLEHVLQNSVIKPVCNQIEINATLAQHELVDYCQKRSIVPVAYTPLGLLSDARPEFFHKAVIKTDPKLGYLAEKHNKTRAQILLRYLIQRGISPLPKSFTKARIEQNFDLFDFQLSDDDMAVVESYNINHRCVPGQQFTHLKQFPFER